MRSTIFVPAPSRYPCSATRATFGAVRPLERTASAALLFLCSCATSAARSDLARPPAAPVTQCRWFGEQMLGAGVAITSSADGPVIARFTGRPLVIETVVRAADGRRHRFSARSDGFVLRGWIDASDLRLRATRPIALLGEQIVLERGSAALVHPTGGALVARARFSPFSASAPVACESIAVGEQQRGRAEPLVDAVHIRLDGVALHRASSGPALGSIETNGRIASYSRIEARDGRVRVRVTGAVTVDGWVDRGRIEEGEGPDCDDCDDYAVVDATDACDDADVDNGCPERSSVETWSGAPAQVFREPSEDAARVGTLETGGRYIVRERRAGWASVAPARFVFSADTGGFWVRMP
jgi:hypothetical protein